MPRGWARVGALPKIFDADEVRVRRDRKSKPKLLVDFSSTDEEFREPPPKRKKNLKPLRSPKVAKTSKTPDLKTDLCSKLDIKSCARSGKSRGNDSEKSDSESNESWVKTCDSLISQLSLFTSRTTSRNGDAKPAKRGRGRHPKAGLKQTGKVVRITRQSQKHATDSAQKIHSSSAEWISDPESQSSVIIEEYIASDCDESVNVEVLDDQISENRQTPEIVTVKEESIEVNYENYHSRPDNLGDLCSVISLSEDSTPSQSQVRRGCERNKGEVVVVKREICDCDGGDLQCCGAHSDRDAVLEVPASPIIEETEHLPEDSKITGERDVHIQENRLHRSTPGPPVSSFSSEKLEGSVSVHFFETVTEHSDTRNQTGISEISTYPFTVSNSFHDSSKETTVEMEVEWRPCEKVVEETASSRPVTEVTVDENVCVKLVERCRSRPCKADSVTDLSVISQDTSKEIVVNDDIEQKPSGNTDKCVTSVETTKGNQCRPHRPGTVISRESFSFPFACGVREAADVVYETHRENLVQSRPTHMPSQSPKFSTHHELVSQKHSSTDADKLLHTPRKQLKFNMSSDTDDFLGFSSGTEEEYTSTNHQSTGEMATPSTRLYSTKLSQSRSPVAGNLHSESGSSQTREQVMPKSIVDMALEQLKDLGSTFPPRLKKPVASERKSSSTTQPLSRKTKRKSLAKSELKMPVNHPKSITKSEPKPRENQLKSEPNILETFTQDLSRKCASASDSSSPGAPVLNNRSRITDEVTVTNAPIDCMDKVMPATNDLDKMRSSSDHAHFADRSKLRTYSRVDHILNETGLSKSSTLKGKVIPASGKHLTVDNVTSAKNQLKERDFLLKNGLFKDQGTSPIENELKDKIPSTYSTAMDRLSVFNGTALDRIIQSTRSIPLLDTVTNHTARDTAGINSSTSTILKNFKSDGIVALENIVLKEQVRQLQKELFLHKQMLIDSEQTASLLQRRLELQAQLPCVNCVNLRRRYIGKETLI